MNIFESIQNAHKDLPGWCSWSKAQVLASIVIGLRPRISLEIGVFGGKSLIPIAMAHQHVKVGRAIGIDPWSASASMEGQSSQVDREYWANQKMHDQVREEFMSARSRLALEDYLEVNQMRSSEYVLDMSRIGIGLLSVDGNHGPEAVKDVQKFSEAVVPGGIVVMDDLKWTGGSVSRAMEVLLDHGFKELYRVENNVECWAVLQGV